MTAKNHLHSSSDVLHGPVRHNNGDPQCTFPTMSSDVVIDCSKMKNPRETAASQ
jgi:hypothetical protein